MAQKSRVWVPTNHALAITWVCWHHTRDFCPFQPGHAAVETPGRAGRMDSGWTSRNEWNTTAIKVCSYPYARFSVHSLSGSAVEWNIVNFFFPPGWTPGRAGWSPDGPAAWKLSSLADTLWEGRGGTSRSCIAIRPGLITHRRFGHPYTGCAAVRVIRA